MRSLALVSGGIESAVLLHKLVASGRTPIALFFDYAQRGAAHERSAALAACASARIAPPVCLDLRSVGEAFRASNRLHVPLPHRNLVLLSLSLGWATTHGCDELALGLTSEDFAKDSEFAAAGAVRYTTGTAEFCDHFRRMAAHVAPGVELTLPMAHQRKHEVIREAQQLGVELSRTYSCMRACASGRHCGTCLQCEARRAAFAAAGVSEPERFYER
ncbi:hypothetical protein AB1Y20_012079 [Prymnesium parvum]|uniref:7-cyano-7-deazaguanine synthase n=1 Tax=Prymnesium parvum TaxID=97485 RepID=A0AB34ING3_PRYPA